MVFASLFSKIADVRGGVSNMNVNCESANTSNNLENVLVDSWKLEDGRFLSKAECDYEPPNYGAPNSHYGSGTR
ncbi:MAG: hypothetical protein QNJ47_12230 [Nostocaceae cyanobacterium]|nr:hypothetical protein [Nostocaceae cyanobacterium]